MNASHLETLLQRLRTTLRRNEEAVANGKAQIASLEKMVEDARQVKIPGLETGKGK